MAGGLLAWGTSPAENWRRAKSLKALLVKASQMHPAMVHSVRLVCFGYTGPGAITPTLKPVEADGLHEPAAVPFLLEIATRAALPTTEGKNDKSFSFWGRCMAVTLVGAYERPEVIPTLSELLTNEVFEVRACAATGLAESKTAEAVDGLIRALSDKSDEVRASAHSGLVRLTGQDFRGDGKAYEVWWATNKSGWRYSEPKRGQ